MPSPVATPFACEKRNNRLAVLLLAGCLAAGLSIPVPLRAADGSAAIAAAAEEEAHGESLLAFLSRLANFAILAGGLGYLLRNPVKRYLEGRLAQIRGDLDTAAQTTARAEEEIARLERNLAALPDEIARLKTRGAEEIAAEEARITRAAEEERERLLEQTRREIDLRLRLARQELLEHAADLAVGRAREQIRREVTPADQARLLERYVSHVKGDR